MKAIRDNLAFILLGVFAVVLVFFMLRLQNLIMATQQPAESEVVDTPETILQQPTVIIAPTATNTPEPPPTAAPTDPPVAPTAAAAQPAANSNAYQVYGSLVIGAIHVGSANDRGYNQAHDEGIQQMVERIPDVRVISEENVPETEEVIGVIDQMIQQGAQIIFAQSFGYLPFVVQAAEANPGVTFLHPGGFELRPNLGTYWANNYEAMYLAGIAAGATSQTGELGFITAFPIPNILASVNAFHLGARSVNPTANTHLVITESWVDPEKEAAAVNALSAINVDTVTMIVDSPITVVQTAEALGMYSIGFHSAALRDLAPNGWLTGIAYTWGNYYTSVVQQIRSGQWQASHVRGGIESDMLQLAAFGPAVNEDTRNRIVAARTDIIRGQLQIFQGPITDNEGLERIPSGRAGGLELLDTTDWLVAGVTEFDVNSVDVQPLPALPTPPPAAVEDAPTAPVAAVPTEAPAPTAAPVSTADLIFGTSNHHPECYFFTDVISQLIERDLGLDVEIVDFADDATMYAAIANRHEQRTVDLTACFGDPDDRPVLREYFGFVKHIGDTFWTGPTVKLQVLSNAGFSVEVERDQTCLYRFLKNIYFEGEDIATQAPEQWIADNAEMASSWTSCELLP
ncbi:MAG: BMP family ABC transporter substrate-binding protein [Caldilineaceae bacterium]|nr:BMP family ABC transporter substrate-binding protein [Caldilineaceae bacterium]